MAKSGGETTSISLDATTANLEQSFLDLADSDRRVGWDTTTKFLHDLLFNPNWLRAAAESEQEIAEKLGTSKSSARETAIAFIRIGAFERVADGIQRKSLSTEQLIPLYALRLRIELQAFAQIFAMNGARRAGLAKDLGVILGRQQQRHRAKDFIGWLQEGINFHAELVSRADLADLTVILRNLMLQIRVGSFLEQDRPASREAAMKEHLLYISLVGNGPQGGPAHWHEIVEEHILKSFVSAVQALPPEGTAPAILDDFRKSPIWKAACSLAREDPVLQGSKNLALKREAST